MPATASTGAISLLCSAIRRGASSGGRLSNSGGLSVDFALASFQRFEEGIELGIDVPLRASPHIDTCDEIGACRLTSIPAMDRKAHSARFHPNSAGG